MRKMERRGRRRSASFIILKLITKYGLMQRRKFIKKTLITSLGTGLAAGLYTWKVEPFWLDFEHVHMPLRNLPEALIGKKMIQISDMHVGDRFDYSFLIDSMKKARRFNPEIVVYTGDFLNYENKSQFKQFAEVTPHMLKGRSGTLAVMGNHDYGKNWASDYVGDRVISQLSKTGIKVLRNEHADIKGLRFLGIDDFWGPHFDPAQALQYYNPKKACITLCHNPDVCDLNIWSDFKGWILSGHTHGGQCKPPFLKPPILPVLNKEYTSGVFHLSSNRTLYINRALGHLRQVRFNVRPEITVFHLDKMV